MVMTTGQDIKNRKPEALAQSLVAEEICTNLAQHMTAQMEYMMDILERLESNVNRICSWIEDLERESDEAAAYIEHAEKSTTAPEQEKQNSQSNEVQ